MAKLITKEEASQWLQKNAPYLKLIEWGGAATKNSKFFDTQRNKEFLYEFRFVK